MAAREKATIEQCAKALEATAGFISQAAKKLNITAGALSKKIKRSKKLQDLLDDILENQLDFSESVLFKNMKQTDNLSVAQKAVEFHLKYKGGKRGYISSERHIHEGGDEPMKINVTVSKIKPKEIKGGNDD